MIIRTNINTCKFGEENLVIALFKKSRASWLKKDKSRLKKSINYISSRRRNDNIFVYTDYDHKIVGYIIFSEYWNTIHIDDIYVKPSKRHKGIATKLVNTVIESAKFNDYEMIHSDSDIDKKQMINFHKKLGFQHIGTLKNYRDIDCNFFKLKLK